MEKLPVECISQILAFTSAKDVCRLAGVSSTFRSAAECELLWKTFLPEDYEETIALSSSLLPSYLNSLSAKDFYLLLSDHLIFVEIENSIISISVDKEKELVCYMIGVKHLGFLIEAPGLRHQVWKSHPPSRFCEVGAVVDYEFRLEFGYHRMGINEDVETPLEIYYSIYIVFNLPFQDEVLIVRRSKDDGVVEPWDDTAVSRADGWTEIDITGIVTGEEDGAIVFSLKHRIYPPPSGWLIVQGIEFRAFKLSKQPSDKIST